MVLKIQTIRAQITFTGTGTTPNQIEPHHNESLSSDAQLCGGTVSHPVLRNKLYARVFLDVPWVHPQQPTANGCKQNGMV